MIATSSEEKNNQFKIDYQTTPKNSSISLSLLAKNTFINSSKECFDS